MTGVGLVLTALQDKRLRDDGNVQLVPPRLSPSVEILCRRPCAAPRAGRMGRASRASGFWPRMHYPVVTAQLLEALSSPMTYGQSTWSI